MRQKAQDNILIIVIGVVFFLNIIDINFLSHPTVEELTVVGWILLWVGALLYILSVLTLRGKGVGNIVDSGVYGVVRHPMYLGAMIMFFSHIFFGQNWIVAVGAVVAMVCCYLIMLSDEQRNAEKFGDEYKRYMEKVPRMNFVFGIVRLQRRKRELKADR